jgi:hypothetical protein
MIPNRGEEGSLRGLSQCVQLCTGAQINFVDLTPYLTYAVFADYKLILLIIDKRIKSQITKERPGARTLGIIPTFALPLINPRSKAVSETTNRQIESVNRERESVATLVFLGFIIESRYRR